MIKTKQRVPDDRNPLVAQLIRTEVTNYWQIITFMSYLPLIWQLLPCSKPEPHPTGHILHPFPAHLLHSRLLWKQGGVKRKKGKRKKNTTTLLKAGAETATLIAPILWLLTRQIAGACISGESSRIFLRGSSQQSNSSALNCLCS